MKDLKLLNSNALKFIAIFAMTLDHIAWAVFPGYPTEALPVILHIIGRITCPIMCFFIAEGFYYTKDIKKVYGTAFCFCCNFSFCIYFCIKQLC